MPTYTVRCRCGARLPVDEDAIVRGLRCDHCGRSLKVRPRRRSSVDVGGNGRHARVVDRGWRRRVSVWLAMRRRPAVRRARRRRPRGAAQPAALLSRLTWGYLAGSCVVAALMWGLGDRWWPATVLLFMGRWVFLLPLAALVPPALALRPPLLAPLALAALVVAGPIMGARTGWRGWLARPAAGDARLRVVTFNVDGGEVMTTELRRLLAEWEPDVVALQECGEALAAATREVAGWYAHVEDGLCLLSRFPIREARAMDRAALARVRQDAAAGVGGAGYVVTYTLDTPHGPIALTNLHLETPRKGFEGLLSLDLRRLRENTELRDVESALARRWVDRAGTDGQRVPLLVVGDFNTPVESRIFRRHWGDLTDAFSRAGVGLGMTKYNGWIRARIDHVLLGPAWRAEGARVGEDIGSDHRPLIVDLAPSPWRGGRR